RPAGGASILILSTPPSSPFISTYTFRNTRTRLPPLPSINRERNPGGNAGDLEMCGWQREAYDRLADMAKRRCGNVGKK
ncbi:hypothetical protein Moror_12263, partial [Moniliophthora roreri MCA 2997]